MKRRAAATLAVLALVAAGCHSKSKPAPAAGKPTATLVVTRDFGTQPLLDRTVAPGQTVMTALRGVAKIDTRYGGRFVQSIDGVSGSLTRARDWTYFVNGLEARVGATDITLHAGDRVWWDFHPWADMPTIPAVVGSFPEPFVHGTGRPAARVQVRGSAALAAALRQDGARTGSASSPWRVLVGSDAALRAGTPPTAARPGHRSPRASRSACATGSVVGLRRSRHARAAGAGARVAIFAIRAGAGATLYVSGVERRRREPRRGRACARTPRSCATATPSRSTRRARSFAQVRG